MNRCDECPALVKKVDDIHTALVGDIKNQKQSIISKVNGHDKFNKTIVKLFWILITGMVITMGTAIGGAIWL